MYAFSRAVSLLAGVFSILGAVLAALGMVFIVGLISTEIFLRAVMATSTFVVEEIVGYSVAAIGFLALGYTFRSGTLIRVQILVSLLERWPLGRRLLEIFALLVALLVSGYILQHFGNNVQRQFVRNYSSGTVADVPMWIPTGLMLAGIAIFWLQLFARTLEVLAGSAIENESTATPPLVD